VDLYAGAATITAGSFLFAPDHTANDLTGWMKFDSTSLNLDAGATASVGVTIKVPPRASAGERYAVLWAQVAAGGSSPGVRMVSRVGVRVYLDVGPGGEPPSDFQIASLTPGRTSDGSPEVIAQVRNTGKRALDMRGSLWLSDGPSSMSAGPFPARLGTTLGIGQTEPVAVPLDKRLPDGPWNVRLTLGSGTLEHTATATMTFPDAVGTGDTITLGGSQAAGTAVLAAIGGVLLIGGFFFARRASSRWRRR
jgi:hypothetical protein